MDPTPETYEQKLQTAQAAVYATGKLVDEKNANTSSGPRECPTSLLGRRWT